uniref:PARP catalytic domain-containing protein n=1 Tax=Emiliania huxleyi TaxID=2903 RepID=A0A7S3U0U9_EMIHU|mmetsp:Transcript_38277/g.113793  ORF Transcript_38277/g.113793 Transcript_38277/m.113793 type:complete len:214 (+) Transcript_38277:98-739(+)
MKNAKAKKKKSVLKLPELTCDELRKILRIRCKLVLNDFAEKKYDFRYTREKSEKLAHQERGGRKYLPPEGWAKLALAVKDKYASNKWLQKESGWPVVYHGTRARPCIVRGIVREGFKIRGGKETAHNGSRYGQGVYCTPDPAYAVQYAKQQKLESSEHDDEFLVVFQCRVEPDSFTVERDTNDNDSKAIWRVTDPTNLRPCAVLMSTVAPCAA